MCNTRDFDSIYEVVPLERSNEISHTRLGPPRIGDGGIDDNRQSRPDIQQLLRWTVVGATKFEVQPTRRSKHDISPFSAYVHKSLPCVLVVNLIHKELEYLQKGVVGEGADSHSWGVLRCQTQLSNR